MECDVEMIKFGTLDFGEEERNAIIDLVNVKEPQLTLGKYCRQFEVEVARWAGVKHAIFVNSGTSAVLAALSAYGQSVDGASKLIVPALTYCATWNALAYSELFMKLKDVNDGFVVDTEEECLGVDLLGKPCHSNMVVEDATEAMGGTFNGKKLGTFGLMGCYSFHVAHLTNTVEGGMVITDHNGLAEVCRQIRDNGRLCTCVPCGLKVDGKCRKGRVSGNYERRYEYYYNGLNLKPTEFNGVLGCVKMRRIDLIADRRNAIFKIYADAFGDFVEKRGEKNVSIAYPVKVKNPQEAVVKLENVGIETRGMFPPFNTDFKNAKRISESYILLPVHQDLTDKEVGYVVEKVKELK